jgi:hypothetical protein
MLQPKKDKKKPGGGSYITSSNGLVGRTYGMYGPYESMDTTGYSKGKKEFDLKRSYTGTKPTTVKKVKREDVPNVIKAMKSGATATKKI